MTDKEPLAEHEQEILDTALLESDQLLIRSLHDDETRRKRRLWLSVLLIGGVVMSVIVLGIMTGWLAISGPVVAESEEVVGPSDKQWEERLLATKESDRWNVGAKIGMDLVRIPGDRPFDVLDKHWKQIPTSVRKQILKGFTPGMMGNKEMHPRFFDVMHLGMTDSNAGVREYAAGYIEMQGHSNFERDAKGYSRWREKNKSLWREQNKDASAKGTVARVAGDSPDLNDFQRGWKMFFAGKFRTSERLFRRVLEEDPGNLGAINGLGFSVLNQGNNKEAKPLFEKYLTKEKDASGPMNGLARCLKVEGKVSQAIEVWERAAKISPGPNDITGNLAWTYLEQKQYAKSVEYFEILVESAPEDKRSQKGLKRARAGLEQKE